MTLTDAATKACILMYKHGLNDWTFEFDRKKKGFGWCSKNTKTICLSANLVKLNDEAQVTDTILHEIAHALDWIRNKQWGHGPTWKKICVEIGARPEQYFTEKTTVMDKPKYIMKNVVTGQIVAKYYRFPSKVYQNQATYAEKNKPWTKGQLKLFKVQ